MDSLLNYFKNFKNLLVLTTYIPTQQVFEYFNILVVQVHNSCIGLHNYHLFNKNIF